MGMMTETLEGSIDPRTVTRTPRASPPSGLLSLSVSALHRRGLSYGSNLSELMKLKGWHCLRGAGGLDGCLKSRSRGAEEFPGRVSVQPAVHLPSVNSSVHNLTASTFGPLWRQFVAEEPV